MSQLMLELVVLLYFQLSVRNTDHCQYKKYKSFEIAWTSTFLNYEVSNICLVLKRLICYLSHLPREPPQT